VLSGGSFDTAGGYTLLQYLSGKNAFGISADGAMTSRYLSPPVPQNYTNAGTTGDFSGKELSGARSQAAFTLCSVCDR
jgi:hypothetical protein